MAVIPYMPLYVADYMADTQHLRTEEHGAYLLLIMAYWQSKSPLRSLNGRLAAVARMTDEQWETVQPALAEFFEEQDGFWHHKRIDAELERFRAKSEQASKAGKASAARRRNGRSTDVQRMSNHTDTDTYNVVTSKEVLVCQENSRSESDEGVTKRTTEESQLPEKAPRSVSSQTSFVPNPDDENLTETRIHRMAGTLHAYMCMDGTKYERKFKPPDDAITRRCLLAIGLVSLDDVGKFLHDRYSNYEQSPRHAKGPKSYAWFETVLKSHYGRNGNGNGSHQ